MVQFWLRLSEKHLRIDILSILTSQIDNMNRILLLITFLTSALVSVSQATEYFPEVELETTKDRIINSSSFAKASYPKVIVFWLTTDRNSIMAVNALNDVTAAWSKEYQAQTIAISLDNAKQIKKVIPFIRSNKWILDCYLDPSAKSMIELKGENVPLTLIVDGAGKVIWKKEGYTSTTLSEVREELIKLTEE